MSSLEIMIPFSKLQKSKTLFLRCHLINNPLHVLCSLLLWLMDILSFCVPKVTLISSVFCTVDFWLSFFTFSASRNEINVMFILHLGETLSREDVQTYLDHLLNFTNVIGNTSVSVRNVTIPKGKVFYLYRYIKDLIRSSRRLSNDNNKGSLSCIIPDFK